MPYLNIALAVLTLVERGVVTATRAKALLQQGEAENWDEGRWRVVLIELSDKSDSMFADTQAMLDALQRV